MVTYSINFKNGMAICPHTGWIGQIVRAERAVKIAKHTDDWVAFNYGSKEYEAQNYVSSGPLLTVPGLAVFHQHPWFVDRFHKPSPSVDTGRHFLLFSKRPGRIGYFTDIDILVAAMDSEPVGTVAVEVPDTMAAIGDLQRLIAKEVLRFSGYFDTRDFQMLENVPVNQLVDLPYLAFMQAHCILPSGLQTFSVYGYAEPQLAPSGKPDPLPDPGCIAPLVVEGGD